MAPRFCSHGAVRRPKRAAPGTNRYPRGCGRRHTNAYTFRDADCNSNCDPNGHAYSYTKGNAQGSAQSASATDAVVIVGVRGQRTAQPVTDLGDAGRLREVRPG
jgi:hypothetical protein